MYIRILTLFLSTTHELQGTLFRLYYPCQSPNSSEKPDWIPCKEYFNGLADFMKMSRAISERIFNYLFGKHFAFILYYMYHFYGPLGSPD